jgi:uncharacterized protein (TIGR02145 family)
LPNVRTDYASTITSITSNSATLSSEVSVQGVADVSVRGMVYGINQSPTIADSIIFEGSGQGHFICTLTNLTASTLYYARAFATNIVGTTYGNEINFTTLPPLFVVQPQPCTNASTITDIDGNTYNTVQIGLQCWMKSNLNVSRYRNGDSITIGHSNVQWDSVSTGLYRLYDSSTPFNSQFGKLYNWYTINDTRGICPTGWHVPTVAEWSVLVETLGGHMIAGGALKSTESYFYNGYGTNSSGFTGLGGGVCGLYYGINSVGETGNYWSSSLAVNGYPSFYRLTFDNINVGSYSSDPRVGMSLRCTRD